MTDLFEREIVRMVALVFAPILTTAVLLPILLIIFAIVGPPL